MIKAATSAADGHTDTASSTPGPNRAWARRGARAQRLGIDPTNGPVITWMCQQRLAGHNMARVTRALNDMNIPCPAAADRERNPHRTTEVWTLTSVRGASDRRTRAGWRRHDRLRSLTRSSRDCHLERFHEVFDPLDCVCCVLLCYWATLTDAGVDDVGLVGDLVTTPKYLLVSLGDISLGHSEGRGDFGPHSPSRLVGEDELEGVANVLLVLERASAKFGFQCLAEDCP